MAQIKKISKLSAGVNTVMIVGKSTNLKKQGLSDAEIVYVNSQWTTDKKIAFLNRYGSWVFVIAASDKKDKNLALEYYRKQGAVAGLRANDQKLMELFILDADHKPAETLAFAEGLALANYRFQKYKKDKVKDEATLNTINIVSAKIQPKEIDQLNIVVAACYEARTLVNEPVIYLTAEQLAREFQRLGKESGFTVDVFNKAKIESLKMGGLLAVNYGSKQPPTFTVMEWKPRNARNKKPFILVGKGVVYDTGGLSLKPTAHSMDMMKCDMAGGAAVGATMSAIAKAKLPVHVIGLVPATDNRPGETAYTPGDVIFMHDGSTVEVLNTDAEGRMILADALSYAKKYEPQLVIDLATLTGAANAAICKYGIVCMGTADEKTKNKLKQSGNQVSERLVEFPFWDDYADLLKSDIADMKNIGGATAGAITAGKFLEKFTNYPWMHFDIAGPAFLLERDAYKTSGGTGVGVRLLFDFFKNI